jgi:glycerol-3-phosphate dehydrogenase
MPADRLASAYLYYDARTDDARLCLTVARTAAAHGAVVLNGANVVGFHKDGERIDGASVVVDGEELDVRARVVVNAGGVWSDEVRALDEGVHPDSIRPAKGVHLTIPWDKVQNDIAVVIPVPKDKRSLFVVPWGDHTYVGTTDTDYHGPIDDPQCTQEDMAYVLRALNHSVTTGVTEADVTGTWAGLRPLVKRAESGRTADLSRLHKVGASGSGLINVTGGKLTTYRRMAADTVDLVMDRLERRGRSRTKRLHLLGADGYEEPAGSDRRAHLMRRYGTLAHEIEALITEDSALAEPLVPGLAYVAAEAVYAARHEMARSVDDVLSRRTRSRLFDRAGTAAAADAVARLLAPELGWSDGDVEREAAAYRRSAEHEAAVLHDASDQALDAAFGA